MLDLLLRTVMIRHAKSQRTLDGHSLLQLPPMQVHYVPVTLSSYGPH